MRVGSAEVGGLIEVVEFSRAADLAWTSITGVDQRGRWRLRAGRRRPHARASCGSPTASPAPGISGWLAEQLAAPTVRGHLRRSLQQLKRQVEHEQLRAAAAAARRRGWPRAASACAVGERACSRGHRHLVAIDSRCRVQRAPSRASGSASQAGGRPRRGRRSPSARPSCLDVHAAELDARQRRRGSRRGEGASFGALDHHRGVDVDDRPARSGDLGEHRAQQVHASRRPASARRCRGSAGRCRPGRRRRAARR